MPNDDRTDEQGFDESDAFSDDERVTLVFPDGVARACVVVAEVEIGDGVYAVLMEEDGEDGLFVAAYDEQLPEAERYRPVEDEQVLAAVQAVLDSLAGTVEDDADLADDDA
jgi:hypothetical protein